MLFREYTYSPDTKTHKWSVVGKDGGVHVWATDNRDKYPNGYEFEGLYGGIECHRRKPADYQEGREADFDNCWLLRGPCWCDGSSLQFEEECKNDYYVDAMESGDYEPFFSLARRRYTDWIGGEDADAEVKPEIL